MLELIRGDTENITVTFKDENGNALDLTNSAVYFTIKRNKTQS